MQIDLLSFKWLFLIFFRRLIYHICRKNVNGLFVILILRNNKWFTDDGKSVTSVLPAADEEKNSIFINLFPDLQPRITWETFLFVYLYLFKIEFAPKRVPLTTKVCTCKLKCVSIKSIYQIKDLFCRRYTYFTLNLQRTILPITIQCHILTHYRCLAVENILSKGEIAIFPFPTMFFTLYGTYFSF